MRLNFLRKETARYQKKTALKAILFTAVLLCAGLFTYGTAYAANIEINDTSYTWADAASPINLADGDTLTIDTTSSPSNPTIINVNGASATIIQNNSATIENIYIVANANGTVLNIENLNMKAPDGCYGIDFRGTGTNTINVEGIVSVTGTGAVRHAVNSAYDLKIDGNGSLNATGANGINSGYGIYAAGAITISAQTTATGGTGTNNGHGIYASTGDITISAQTTATGGIGSNGSHGIYANSGDITISAQTTAKGGNGNSGGNGIRANNNIIITSGAFSVDATGGNGGTGGAGGSGISAAGTITISAQTTAKGGNGNSGGFGIYANSGDITISAAVPVEAKSGTGSFGGADFYHGTGKAIIVTASGATLIGSTRAFTAKIQVTPVSAVLTLKNITLTAPASSYGVDFQGTGTNTLNVEGVVSVTGAGEDGHAVYSTGGLKIGGTATGSLTATGGTKGTYGRGGVGIYADDGEIIISAQTTAAGGDGYNGHGIYADDGDITISAKTTATGAYGNGANFCGQGIYANRGNITISAQTTATGGSGDYGGSNGDGGSGIIAYGNITISAQTTAAGGSGDYGGIGIAAYGDITISAQTTATGGGATNLGNGGGHGIYANIGDITISAKTTATGGSGGIGYGSGIILDTGELRISAVVTAKGGNCAAGALSISGNAVVLNNNAKFAFIEKTGAANAKLILTDGANAKKTDIMKTNPNLNLKMGGGLVGTANWASSPAGEIIGNAADEAVAVLTTDAYTIEIYLLSNATPSGGGTPAKTWDELVTEQLNAKKEPLLGLTTNSYFGGLSGKTLNSVNAANVPLSFKQGIFTMILSPELIGSLGLKDSDTVDISMKKTTANGLDLFIEIDETNGELLLNAVDVTFEINGKSVTSFAYPVIFSVDISSFNLTSEQKANLTGIRILINGEVVQLGGYVDGNNFIFTTQSLSKYGIAISGGIIKIVTTINSTTYTVNGEKKTTDVAPMIIDSRTMVPVRFIAEAFGADVTWTDATKTVGIALDGESLSLTIGQKSDGMDVAPVIIDGRTLVPLRYISEKLGANVVWDEETKSIEIYR